MKYGSPAPVPTKTASNPSSSSSSSMVIDLPMTALHSSFAPSFRMYSTSACTISFGRRNSGMPYMSTPPALCSASKIVTSCPIWTRSPATVSPAGPAPTTATRLPVGAPIPGISTFPVTRSKSATNRSRRPMATGSPFFPRTHGISHCSSWGQTRPHTAGSALVSLIFLAASMNFPLATRSMNSGIWTLTGHPFTHCGFLHWMQRDASRMARSGVSPNGTSRKFPTRTCGGCSGIGCRGMLNGFGRGLGVASAISFHLPRGRRRRPCTFRPCVRSAPSPSSPPGGTRGCASPVP